MMNSSLFLWRTGTVVLCLLLSSTIILVNGHDTSSPYRQPLSEFSVENVEIQLDSSIIISVDPPILNNTAEWVTVTFSGISEPNITDMVAVYSPSNVNFSATAPIKYQFANFSDGFMSTGKGSIQFNLINMYSDYIFAFYTNGTKSPTLVALSNTVNFSDPNPPLQTHISLTGNPSQMRVSWSSGTVSQQFIKWGTESGVYTNMNESQSYTYSKDLLCGPPATTFGWRDPGFLQTYVIDGLSYPMQVYYVVGSDQIGWTQESFFSTAIPAGPQNDIKIIAYGDMGKGEVDQSDDHWEEYNSLNTTYNTYNKIVNEGFQMVLHIGDIAYAVGYSSEWDEFLAQILPVASLVPYMTIPGNHERDYINSNGLFNVTDSGGECGHPYELRFQMPNSNHEVQWYSFDFGNVHFVMTSTELNFTQGSEQYEFIMNDLDQVDRSVTPWVIFAGHRPMYVDSENNSTGTGDQFVARMLRRDLEDVLVKYDVDLAIWGHHHTYQRTCPVYDEVCHYDQKLPIHCVIGMAGFILTKNIQEVPPPYMEVVDDMEFGYTTIETTTTSTSTSLTLTYFSNANVIRDQFTLTK